MMGNRTGCPPRRPNDSPGNPLAFPSRRRPTLGPYRQERVTLSDDNNTPDSKPNTKKAAGPSPKITKKTAVVGAAIGIGSAAIVAALLYTNRNNSGGKS